MGPLAFTLLAAQYSNAVVTVDCSNTNLVENIRLTLLSDGNPTDTMLLTVIPRDKKVGIAQITVVVEGVLGLKTTIALNLIVDGAEFFNCARISIPTQGKAAPYPSVISVRGFNGLLDEIEVNVVGLTHTYPQDVQALLVAPYNTNALMLMAHAGTGTSVTNLFLTFTDKAADPVPGTNVLGSQPYRPADYSTAKALPAPAPPRPYATNLSSLNGLNPNGDWKLYVLDDSPPDVGNISFGWSLSIRTRPVLNVLWPVLEGYENTPLSQYFTIGGDSASPAVYTFCASSDNQSVLSNGGILFNGSGTNWTITINPLPNATGSARITVTLFDRGEAQVSTSFKVTFFCPSPAFRIQPVPDQTITAGNIAVVPLRYWYWCWRWPTSVTLTLEPSNTNLVTLGNLKVVGTNLMIWPTGNQTGATRIRVTAVSGGLADQIEFQLNVVPGPSSVFANTASIAIGDKQPAMPYPSMISVSGLPGSIRKVTTTLRGMTHTFPPDVSILLVGPQGQNVVLMSRAGRTGGMGNCWLAFDDAANITPPRDALIADGTYAPADYGSGGNFFPPAPPAPYGATLSVFDGTNPNGTWSLYVQDDQIPDSGLISGGWTLNILTQQPLLKVGKTGDWLKLTLTEAVPNSAVILQTTSDFNVWENLTQATTDSAGLAQFELQLDRKAAQRFYRIQATD